MNEMMVCCLPAFASNPYFGPGLDLGVTVSMRPPTVASNPGFPCRFLSRSSESPSCQRQNPGWKALVQGYTYSWRQVVKIGTRDKFWRGRWDSFSSFNAATITKSLGAAYTSRRAGCWSASLFLAPVPLAMITPGAAGHSKISTSI